MVGTAIVIPASTEVTGSPLRFYAEGVGPNVVVKNCSRMMGQVAVFGDSLASIVKFDGQVPKDSETPYHYVAAHSGTALLASELNGFDYFQTIYMGGLGGFDRAVRRDPDVGARMADRLLKISQIISQFAPWLFTGGVLQ